MTADTLRAALPACDDAPLALALLRLLAGGEPVTTAALAAATARTAPEVATQVGSWPNVERDERGAVVGFSGLSLRTSPHVFEVGGRRLYTWCAWDTLFLPVLLGAAAHVQSTCPVTGAAVEITVDPDGIRHAEPDGLFVSFPPAAETDSANITRFFCCHVHFLASADAARAWRHAHPDHAVLDLQAAFALGCGAIAPLTGAAAGAQCC